MAPSARRTRLANSPHPRAPHPRLLTGYPKGHFLVPRGHFLVPRGHFLKGTLPRPEGKLVLPKGQLVLPKESSLVPKGTPRPEGTLLAPQGSSSSRREAPRPAGKLLVPQGSSSSRAERWPGTPPRRRGSRAGPSGDCLPRHSLGAGIRYGSQATLSGGWLKDCVCEPWFCTPSACRSSWRNRPSPDRARTRR